jgi:uncharacterized small protein (DUF1192 family)
MAREDDEEVRSRATHEVGAKLDELSISEIDARIELLRQEILRLESARSLKKAALASAGSFFKS